MAIIGKIRDKSWLILIIVGGALLAFILGDWQKMTGGIEEEFGYGLVYGEKVDKVGFDDKVKEAQANAQAQKDRELQQRGLPPGSENAPAVDQTQVWNQYIQELVLEREYEALGLMVSDGEFDAYLYAEDGFQPLPDLKNAFTDSLTGLFNAEALRARIDQLKNSEVPEEVKSWEESEKYYRNQRLRQKYFDILGQGVYVTNLEAKNEYMAKSETKTVTFVMKRFSEIKDEEIDMSDAKLKAWFEKHKEDKKYENKVTMREVRFADVTLEPSSEDTLAFNKEMDALKEAFAAAEDDSTFAMDPKNSDKPGFTSRIGYRPEGTEQAQLTYPKYLDSTFIKAEIGELVGPYQQEGAMKLAKVVGKGHLLSVRHILIAAQKTDTAAVEVAQVKTDSLMAIVNSDNFEDLVKEHSEDPGSVSKGGKYEDFMEGMMVPEFNDFARDEPIGKIGYVQTDYGFHIIEVLDRKENVVPKLAVVQKTLTPSETTIDGLEEKAYDVLDKLYTELDKISDPAKKVARFDTIMKKEDMFVRPINIQDDAPSIHVFTSAFAEDEVYKLAFSEGAQVGDLVGAPLKDGNKRIIAILSSIKVKGEVNFEDVRTLVENDYRNEMKAKRIASAMQGKSIEALTADGKYAAQTANVTFANPQLGNVYDPEVVGAIFSGLEDLKVSLPITGKQGVYVVRVDKTELPTAATSFDEERDQMVGSARGRLQGDAQKALVKNAEVIDNRKFYGLGIRR